MADQTKGTSRSIYIDSQAAEAAMRRLQSEGDKLRTKLDSGELAGKNLNKTLAKLDENNAKIKSIQQQLDAGLKPTLIQQQNLVRQLGNELARLSSNDVKFKGLQETFLKQTDTLQKMKEEYNGVAKAQEGASGFGKIFEHVAEAFTSFVIIEKASELVKEFFTGSIEEAHDAEQSVNNLLLTLENAGRLSIFPDLIAQAQKFADKYRALDNDDITKVFTKLVDYGKLTRTEMVSVTDVIINFARKQQISLGESSDTITKLLEGSGKALKVFGINVKDATTFNERLALVTGTLADKLKGVESTFEEGGQGRIAKYQQKIKDLEEDFGKLIEVIVTPAPSEETAFKDAQKQADELNKKLQPLLDRYDVLKGKTKLNTAEQTELNVIINKIAGILPQIATGFDKYGNAIDINKDKLKEFNKEQLAFIQAKEADAIKSLKNEAEDLAKSISSSSKNLNKAIEDSKSFGNGSNGNLIGVANARAIQAEQTNIARNQDRLLEINEKLSTQYKITLPESIQTYLETAKKAKFGTTVSDVKSDEEKKKDAEIVAERNKKDQEEAKKKAEELEKKAEEARKKLEAIEKELKESFAKSTLPELEAEYVKIQETLKKTLQDIYATSAYVPKERIEKDVQLAIDTAGVEINKAFEKFHKSHKSNDFSFQLHAAPDQKQFEDELEKSIGKSLDTISKKPSIVDRVTNFFNRDKKAGNELKVLKSQPGSKEELNAKIAQLHDQEKAELDSTEHTEQEIALIRERYRQAENKLVIDYYKGKVDEVLGYVQQAIGILNQFNQAQTASENAELQRQIKNNDKKRREIERLAKSKVLTEIEASRQLNALDISEQKKKDDLEKKQLERGKKIAIAQALVNGAMGITAVLAAKPGVSDILTLGAFRAINIALTVATTAAQIAAISGQKFEKGGIPQGASHAQGGIKLVDSKSKRVVGEMEGGEPYMILSKNFRRNNPEFIAAALDSSMNRNGARIRPFWESRPYTHLAYGGLISGQQVVKKFEQGGITGSGGGQSSAVQSDQLLNEIATLIERNQMVMERMIHSTDTLNGHLDNGIKSSFSLKQLDDAYDQRSRIIREATG